MTESWSSYANFSPPINTGQPIQVLQDRLIGAKFNDLVDFYLHIGPASMYSFSRAPAWEQNGISLGRQVVNVDECNQPFGYDLKARTAAWSVTSYQPSSFLPLVMRRGWESGVDVGPENEARFNQSLISIGIPRAADALRTDLTAVILDNPAQVNAIVKSVIEELTNWLKQQMAPNAPKLDLFKIMVKTHEFLGEYFQLNTMSPNPAEDREIKDLSLDLFRDDNIDSLILIASTDATWKAKRWMSVGNDKLGGALSEKAGHRWGVNYGRTNMDPYMPDKQLLIQRLSWWVTSIADVAEDAGQITTGVAELYKTAPPSTQTNLSAAIFSPSDRSIKSSMVNSAQQKIQGFISGIADPDPKKSASARDELADYLVSLANNLSQTPETYESREMLLAHVALGPIARIVVLGSLLPPKLVCTYDVDQNKSFVRNSPFNSQITELSTTLLITGPDPRNELRTRVFSRRVLGSLKKLNGEHFAIGPLTYNPAKKAYEITLATQFASDWKNYIGPPLQIRVPTYLYGNTQDEAIGLSQPHGQSPPEYQVVWEWTGQLDAFSPPPTKPPSVSERTQQTVLQVPITTTTYPWRLSANLPIMVTPWMEYGSSIKQPKKWKFPSDLERLTVTKGILETWGGVFGSEGWMDNPVYFSWMLQRWPDVGETDKYLLSNQLPAGANKLSGSDVSRMAENSLAGATDYFLKTDQNTLRLNSLGWSRAWEQYVKSRVFRVAASQDPSNSALFGEYAIKYGSAAIGAMLWETLPGIMLYKGQSWVTDLKDRALLDALRAQHWLGAAYDNSTPDGHQQTEFYAHYALGSYERWGGGRILPQITSPLYIDQAPFNFTLRNALTLYLHHAYDKTIFSSPTSRVSLGYNLALGGIFNTGALFGTSPLSAEIGNYMEPSSSKYGFSAKEYPGTMPVWTLNAKILAEKNLSQKTTVWGELDLNPSLGDYYYALKGVNWFYQRMAGGPDLDTRIKNMGLDINALISPPPINFTPLGNLAAVQSEFDAMNTQLDANARKSISEMKSSELVVAAKGGRAFRIKKEGANYNIYDDPSTGNQNYLNPVPIADLRFGLGTEIPLSKIFNASIGTLFASFDNEWQLNSASLKRIRLRALYVSPDGDWAGQASWAYDQGLRGPVNDFGAGVAYKYYKGSVGDLLINANVKLDAGLRLFSNPVTNATGGMSPFARLTLSFQLDVPSKTEQVQTSVYTQTSKSIMNFDCEGRVRDWKFEHGPIQTERFLK